MKTKRFLSFVLVFAMLTAMLCQGAAAATDTVLTALAISDTAVTFGFDKGTGDSGTFYKKYTVTVKPEGGETETVSANNIITYVEKNGNELRRLVTVKGLKESIDEVYPGELGKLAEDQVRSQKNIAIGVITCASRCAIEGGINAEAAFSMADGYIR